MKRSLHAGWLVFCAIGCLALIAGCASGSSAAKPAAKPVEKIKIAKLDDLPKHTYPCAGKVMELVQSDQKIAELGAKVRADIEADLAKYEIDDASTVQRMYATLLAIDMLEKKYDAALARIEQIRALESKEAKKLMTGLTTEAVIAARRQLGENAAPSAYKQAFRAQFAGRVAKLPWKVVQDEVQQNKGRLELLSENLISGTVQARMQPTVDQTGELNAELAGGVIGIRLTLKEQLPLKDEIIAVYQDFIADHAEAKADIWAERAVLISAADTHTPVLIAAWDSGTDPSVFEQQLWTNPKEKADGRDDDGNGYVDDVHGIAYDVDAHRNTELVCPLEDAAPRMPTVMEYMKGLMDLQASIDSPEAAALKKHIAGLDPAEVKGFMEDLGLAGNYAHGTHVAGIMLDGNPWARLLIARLSYDHRTVPIPRTVEWAQRDAAKCRDTVAYFKQNGVRVVNMSWGEQQDDAESSLEKNGIGKTAEERLELARQVFALQKQGLYEAIKGAPDILFVCAAGNADNDVEFDQDIPSSFDLPNLLVVGAVDQTGEPTSFTSFGRTVQVYASGFEVDSFVPGGKRMKMSGTSMASPAVANLAAKLLVLDPSLTPSAVIRLIKEGADRKTAGARSILLLNPKHSVELLHSQRQPK